jgi:hypothetical protein
MEGSISDSFIYGSCPKKTQRARESRSFGAVAHFRRALKMEKSAVVSRTWGVYFNPGKMARRSRQYFARFDARNPKIPAGAGMKESEVVHTAVAIQFFSSAEESPLIGSMNGVTQLLVRSLRKSGILEN